MARERGSVKWFNEQKGFGFIVRENGGKDAFVHFSGIRKAKGDNSRVNLYEGDEVEFTMDDSSPKGPSATDVVVTREGPRDD